MKKIFALILPFFASVCLQAQDQYLVTTKLDTISGKIFLYYGGPYKADEAGVKIEKEKTEYPAYEVKYVSLGEKNNYEVLKINQRYQFAQIKVKGKYLSYYSYVDPESNSHTNYSLSLLVKWNGAQLPISSMLSRQRLAEFLEECKDVSQQIEAGELKKKNMDKIIGAYDLCLEKSTSPSDVQAQVPAKDGKYQALLDTLKESAVLTEDLTMMLEDIKQKLQTGKSIPEYLQKGVLDQLGEQEALKSQFLEYIQNN